MAVDEDTEQEYVPPKKKASADEEKRRKSIVPGSLMKALIRPGGGDSRPADGDQVIYHCTVRTLDGVVVESTRSDFGGKGTPIRQVLGKSKMILGLLEGIPSMLKGEVAMFKMKPQLHYGEADCPVSVSNTFPKDDELHFEVEMVISDDLGVIKKVINEGQGWESPREPYEVKAWISAKTGDGKLIVSHVQGEPYFFTFGKSEVSNAFLHVLFSSFISKLGLLYLMMHFSSSFFADCTTSSIIIWPCFYSLTYYTD
ncbi:hypothetical protein L1049_009158 [Liquidambar formosana]|uniref:peptidylprolyl isomerase n=1 Tax=Liquidambar formosana TaxID=63359 RepID=A0AAP0S487_LIQFO